MSAEKKQKTCNPYEHRNNPESRRNSLFDGASQRGSCYVSGRPSGYPEAVFQSLHALFDTESGPGYRTAYSQCGRGTRSRSSNGCISEPLNDRNWNMDDALHEVTHVRQDMAGLLKFRPKMNKPQTWTTSTTSSRMSYSPKGKGKLTQPKGKGKQKGKVQWVTEIRQSDGSVKP